MRVLGGVHQHHGVLVEKLLVALNEDIKLAALLERHPGAAIGKRISVGSGVDFERRLHAPTDLLAPMASAFRNVDAGDFPNIEFADVCARAIAARDEWRSLCLDGLKRRHNVARAL